MRFGPCIKNARSTTHIEDGCSRNNRGTQRTSEANNRTQRSINSAHSTNTAEKDKNHVRRNLLIKTDDLLKSILKIGSNSNVQKFPDFGSLKKNGRVRYFKENNITSEDDFIIHIFQLCKNYLDTILVQYRNGNNDNYDNISYALDSLDKYKTYLGLNENNKIYLGLNENNKIYQSYFHVYYLLNILQKLESLRLQL